MDEMTLDDLIKELQALIDKYKTAADGSDQEPTAEDAERMSALTAEIERRNAAAEQDAQTRAARVAAARAAIEGGTARRVDSVPMARAATGTGGVSGVFDTTDYAAAARRAWVKDVATRGGIQLVGGNDFTPQERAAFTHLTSNTDAVVPVELQNEIISLIDNSAVLFGDISRTNLRHQFELPRHKSIVKGDAAKTAEGAAPADDEQNEFDTITLVGEELKKTLKISRKMAVQSLDGFEQYLITELAGRLAVAANAFVHARLGDEKLGIAAANKIAVAKAGTLAKADLAKAFSLTKTFSNPTPKGCFVYANSDTIWNHIAMIEKANGESYFVDEKTEDPTVQGRIFGKVVKQDDSIADGILRIGYPDLVKGNMFDGIDVTAYVATDGSQRHCFDGYALFDCGLAVPEGFTELSIGTAAAASK